VIVVDPLSVVHETVAVISVVMSFPEVFAGAVKVVEKNPPRVFPLKVVLFPLKVPSPEEVRIMEASVRLPVASVMITVMVVVAPAVMGLFPGVTETLAAAPPELPDPVVVPLVTLFCLLTSDVSHPKKIKRAALSNNNKKIEEIGLGNIGFNPNL
jgi:hypothetical protein